MESAAGNVWSGLEPVKVGEPEMDFVTGDYAASPVQTLIGGTCHRTIRAAAIVVAARVDIGLADRAARKILDLLFRNLVVDIRLCRPTRAATEPLVGDPKAIPNHDNDRHGKEDFGQHGKSAPLQTVAVPQQAIFRGGQEALGKVATQTIGERETAVAPHIVAP